MLAFAIDNFLPEEVFKSISDRITKLPQYTTNQWSRWRDDFTTSILDHMKSEFVLRKIWLEGWDEKFYKWSDQVCYVYTPNEPFPGCHVDNGGFILYLHPKWNTEWGGRFYIEETKEFVDPIPNRLVWVNPRVPHCVEPLTDKAPNNRMSIVGFPEGTILQSHIRNQKQSQAYLRP